jgi:hypothetical protein
MIKTRIDFLDKSLRGGIKEEQAVLLLSHPGIDVSSLAQQIFYSALRQGLNGIYLTTNKSVSEVRKRMRENLWNLEEFERKRKVIWIDCFSPVVGFKGEGIVVDPRKVNKLARVLRSKVGKGSFLVIDSLSRLMEINEEAVNRLVDFRTTTLCTFVHWLYPKRLIRKIRKRFNRVIELRAVIEKAIMRTYLRIGRRRIPFKILRPGGLAVHVPKILVTGPYNSGKSTVVQKLSQRAVSIDRLGTTIAFDHGYVESAKMAVDLFGTPGHKRFDWILEILAREIYGIMLVIDSSEPETFARAKVMLQSVRRYGIPYVVLANKQDLRGALGIEEIRKRLDLAKEVPIIPTIAIQGKGLNQALDNLLALIVGEKIGGT